MKLAIRLVVGALLAIVVAASAAVAQPPIVAAVPAEWTLATNDLGPLSRVYGSLGTPSLPQGVTPEEAENATAAYRAWTNESGDVIGVFAATLPSDGQATQFLDGFESALRITPCGTAPAENVNIGCSGTRRITWWQDEASVNVVFGTDVIAFDGLTGLQLELSEPTAPVYPSNIFGSIIRGIGILALLGLLAFFATKVQATVKRNQNTPSYRAAAGRDTDSLLATDVASNNARAESTADESPTTNALSASPAPQPAPTRSIAPVNHSEVAPGAVQSEFFDVNALDTNQFGELDDLPAPPPPEHPAPEHPAPERPGPSAPEQGLPLTNLDPEAATTDLATPDLGSLDPGLTGFGDPAMAGTELEGAASEVAGFETYGDDNTGYDGAGYDGAGYGMFETEGAAPAAANDMLGSIDHVSPLESAGPVDRRVADHHQTEHYRRAEDPVPPLTAPAPQSATGDVATPAAHADAEMADEELPELVFDRPFPPERLAEAADTPNGWIFDIDPAFDLSRDVPPEAILGAWAVGPDGQPTGEYLVNPREDAHH